MTDLQILARVYSARADELKQQALVHKDKDIAKLMFVFAAEYEQLAILLARSL